MAVSLEAWDYVSLALYFGIVIGFGIWSSCKNRGSVGGYFLAGRSMNFIPVGASLFASNIGSGHFIGLAGAGASYGIGTAGFELSAAFVLVLLGWIFLPVYIRAGVYTMPEYIKKRFGGDRIRIYLSCLSLILYVFTKISADLFSGALFIKESLDLDLYVAIVILLFIAALFTIGGGLTAVIWTDFIQTIIMIIGAFYLMFISFAKVGGYGEMKKKFGYSVANTTLYSNTTCGVPTKEYFNLVQNVNSDYPWTGMLLGLTISSIWYWCSDQVIVQRTLAAKNLTHAKAGCILAGYLKILPMFLLVFPGMISRIIYKDTVGCADPSICKEFCRSEGGCSNIAYPKLVITLLPSGARGLMLACMMAALMSSLTSIFNSSSTIFTMDIWKRIRKNAKDWELMVVGRVFVLVLVGVSILWIPIIQASQNSRLFDYIQSITSYLAPPVCAVYIMAIFYKRTNEPGAFWGLMIGLVVGMIRFIWQFSYSEPPCDKPYLEKRPAIIKDVHFLHFGVILFVISCISIFVISHLTEPIPDKYIMRLTYGTIYDEDEAVEMPHSNKTHTLKSFFTGHKFSEDDNVEMKEGVENKGFDNVNDAHKVIVEEPTSDEAKSEEHEHKKIGFFKKGLYWICGIESGIQKDVQGAVEETKLDTSISESSFWSMICDVNAIAVMSVCGFLFAFYNNFSS